MAMDTKLQRLNALLDTLVSYEKRRKENLEKTHELYKKLQIDQKVGSFEELFDFSAINLLGINLQPPHLGQIQPHRYAQIIGIKNSKNINLGYFGRTENLSKELKHDIVSFVLGWRLEKSFKVVDRYDKILKEWNETEVE